MHKIFLLTADGKEGEHLSINPETLEISWGADHEKYSLLDIGEVVSPGHSQCRTISFSVWLPYYVKPHSTLQRWSGYMKNKRVLRLVVMGKAPENFLGIDFNVPVIFEKITVREKGGEPGALFLDLVFKEYRTFSLKVIS